MTATHHTEAHGHSHLTMGPTAPLVASQVPSVPRHWALRVGITAAAVALAAMSLAYGSNADASRSGTNHSSVVAR